MQHHVARFGPPGQCRFEFGRVASNQAQPPVGVHAQHHDIGLNIHRVGKIAHVARAAPAVDIDGFEHGVGRLPAQ